MTDPSLCFPLIKSNLSVPWSIRVELITRQNQGVWGWTHLFIYQKKFWTKNQPSHLNSFQMNQLSPSSDHKAVIWPILTLAAWEDISLLLGRDLTSFRLRQRGVRQCWTDRKTVLKKKKAVLGLRRTSRQTCTHMTKKKKFHFKKVREKETVNALLAPW